MKKRIVLLFVFAAIFFGCKKNAVVSGKSVTGKWKLTEILVSPGPIGKWEPADSNNPEFITFQADGTFSSTGNRFQGVDRYEISTDYTSITFFITATQNQFIYVLKIEPGTLTLSPFCIEPCGLRFVKAE